MKPCNNNINKLHKLVVIRIPNEETVMFCEYCGTSFMLIDSEWVPFKSNEDSEK